MDTRIICVNWGTKYSDKYVTVLHKMVRHYCDLDFDFYCVTDRERDLSDEIIQVPAHPKLRGWWQKIYLFELFRGGRNLYFDLDVVLTGNIDDLFNDDFVSIKDFIYNCYNASVMAWSDELIEYKGETHRSDQEYITSVKGLGVTYPKEWCISYKWGEKTDNTKVVCFHGKPDPHEVDDEYVTRWWA